MQSYGQSLILAGLQVRVNQQPDGSDLSFGWLGDSFFKKWYLERQLEGCLKQL